MSFEESVHILGKPRDDMPMALQLANMTAKCEQAKIYAHFAMNLLNETVMELQGLTNEDTATIRARIMVSAEQHAKERVLAQEEAGGQKECQT